MVCVKVCLNVTANGNGYVNVVWIINDGAGSLIVFFQMVTNTTIGDCLTKENVGMSST